MARPRTSGPSETGSSGCSTSCERRGRPARRTTGPRSCCGWSPSCTAPGSPGVVELAEAADGRRLRRPARSTTSWSPACSSCTVCIPTRSVTRVERALDRCGPFLGQHGGDVELLDIDEDAGAVRLRLLGSCDGCPSSAVTLQHAVERAIVEAAPRSSSSTSSSRRPTRRRSTADARAARPASRWHAYESGGPSALRRPVGESRRADRRSLAVLSRLRRRSAAPKPRPGERCELCAEPIADEHGHVVDIEAAQRSCARAAAATCSSRPRAPAAATTGPCPTATSRSRLRALAGPVGRAADPGQRGVLLRQLDARTRRRVLSQPGRRDRVAAPARHLGRDRRPRTRCSATLRARRRGVPRARRPRDRRDRSASSCRSTPATSWSAAAHALAGLRRRPRGARSAGRVLRRRAGERRRR